MERMIDNFMSTASEKKKKEYERKVLDLLLTHSSFHSYTLKEMRERPDFIISNGKFEIGIEHCCIDMLCFQTPKKDTNTVIYNSIHRLSDKKVKKMYDDFHKDQSDIDQKHDKACKNIESHINEYGEEKEKFNSDVFSLEFDDIVSSHAKKVKQYRQNCSVNSIMLLCEILIPDACYEWIVTEKPTDFQKWIRTGKANLRHYQQLKKIPLTCKMYSTIKNALTAFDAIILIGIPYHKPTDFVVTKYMKQNLAEQRQYLRFGFFRKQAKIKIERKKN